MFKLLEGKDKPGKIGTFLASCMLTMMKVIVMTKMLTIMRPNADKDVDNNEKPDADKADHAVKVEKEAEERLAAAAAAEDGEGGGPPPPKVKTRHAKKSEISPCLHFALGKKHYKFVAKTASKLNTKFRVKRQKLSEKRQGLAQLCSSPSLLFATLTKHICHFFFASEILPNHFSAKSDRKFPKCVKL